MSQGAGCSVLQGRQNRRLVKSPDTAANAPLPALPRRRTGHPAHTPERSAGGDEPRLYTGHSEGTERRSSGVSS